MNRGGQGRVRRALLRLGAALLLLLATAASASVELVGELTTAHFRLRYTARAEGAARALATTIEAEREHFRAVLGRDWPGVTEVRMGVGRAEYDALGLDGTRPPTWSTALAYPRANVVLLEAASLTEPAGVQTLRHELSHVALGQLADGWPHWFQEGLAMQLTGERFAFDRYTTLFRALRSDKVFALDDLAHGWPERPADVEIAYALSLDFIDFLHERHGTAGLGDLIDQVAAGAPFETAFARALHASIASEEIGWRESLRLRYGWLPVATSGSLLWIGLSGLCVVAYVRRRRDKARRMDELAAEEAAEDAAERIRLAEEARLAAEAGALLAPALALEEPPTPDESGTGGTSGDGTPTLH